MCKLSDIVKDREILELVSEFIHLPILDDRGIDYKSKIGCNISSAGFITYLLLNFLISEFDKEFQCLFLGLEYSRFIHEVMVVFPCISLCMQGNVKECEEFFEEYLLSLLDELNLSGNILSIGPGDAPLLCLGALVSLNQDGMIQVEEKKML